MRFHLLLVGLLWFQMSVFAGANLLPNSSFEQGTTAWTLWREDPKTSSGGVSDQAGRAGAHCFKVENRGAGGANLHSDPIPATAETDFTLSVYARTEGAQGVRIGLWALGPDGKTLTYGLPHVVELPTDQPAWARFKCIVTTPPGCVALKAHFMCHGGTVWWDAVQIELGRDVTPYRDGPRIAAPGGGPKNLLSNSGFEDGELDWNLWHKFPGLSSGGVVDAAGRNGGRAYHVLNPGKGGANLYSQPVQCEPGTPYTLSVHARVKNGVGIKIAGWGLDSRQEVISYSIGDAVPMPANVPEYTRFSCTFTTPPDAALRSPASLRSTSCRFLKAHLICNGGEAWWSDVQLERGARATDYETSPKAEGLSRHEGPQAVMYTRAIIREARLKDCFSQTDRLVSYADESKAKPVHPILEEAGRMVDRASELLGARYLVPDYRTVDYNALGTVMDAAEKRLSEIWIVLGRNPSGIFQEWRPRLDGRLDKARIAQEFVIFPCCTRDFLFRGQGSWEILEPYGFRIISGWWGVRVAPDGALSPEELDKIISIAMEHGYKCDISVDGAYAAISLLKDRLGEAIFLHSAKGEWSPAGNCHNTVNIWHPEVRRVAADYLRKVGAYYANNPGVTSYELTNEPSLTIEERVHGYDFKPIGVGGYSPPAREAWRAWLRARYNTIEALNARWRCEYKSFEEVQPPGELAPPAPADGATPVNTGPIYDFQTFRAESHADWFRHCLDAMHAGDPRKPVISQFVSGPMDRKEGAVDLRMMAENAPWDFYGTHDWPGDKPAVESLYAVSMNRKANLPHWEDEFIWSQWERKGTPEPVMRAALERNLWRQIAWGKRGISLFNLESEWLHDSPRNWNNSLLNLEADREVPRYSTGIIPTIERKTNLFKDILYQTRIVSTDVAILRPTAATLITAPDKATRNEGVFMANWLLEHHHMPLMIPEEHIISGFEDLSDLKMLLVPWAVNLPDAVQSRLLKWIEQGGILFATGPVGLFDEYGNPSGALLKAISDKLKWKFIRDKGVWEMVGNAETHTVPGTNTPLAMARLGKGGLYLCSERLSASRQLQIVEAVVGEVLSVPYVRTDMASVEIIPRANASGERFLFIINLDAKAPRGGEVSVRGKFTNVVDLSCEARPQVPARQAQDATIIPLRLPPGGAVFFSLGRPD